jgi:hypothetical protein
MKISLQLSAVSPQQNLRGPRNIDRRELFLTADG